METNDTKRQAGFWDDAEIISQYTRAQAIEDGVLIDVSEMAKEAGFKFPVAVTAELFGLLDPSEELKEIGQSLSGRLWDMLWMLKHAIKRAPGSTDFLMFSVYFMIKPHHQRPKLVQLKSLCGPGDNFEPVITIMMPHES